MLYMVTWILWDIYNMYMYIYIYIYIMYIISIYAHIVFIYTSILRGRSFHKRELIMPSQRVPMEWPFDSP